MENGITPFILPRNEVNHVICARLLSSKIREDFLRTVRDALVAPGEMKALPVLTLFVTNLIAQGGLEGKAEDLIRYFGRSIVERKDPAELALFERLLRERPMILTNGASAVAALTSRILDILGDTTLSAEVRTSLERVGFALGLTRAEFAATQSPAPEKDKPPAQLT